MASSSSLSAPKSSISRFLNSFEEYLPFPGAFPLAFPLDPEEEPPPWVDAVPVDRGFGALSLFSGLE